MTITAARNSFVAPGRRLPSALRLRPLAAALALSQLIDPSAMAGSTITASSGVNHVVTSCADAAILPVCGPDDGTLRQAFNCAQDRDTVDLSQLQCSTITLAAPLTSGPVSLFLSGPGAESLKIEAGGAFRALVHNGRPGDTLYVENVTIANGHYENPYTYGGGGGCIFSSGNVYLGASIVTGCYASSVTTLATGGGIFAKGSVTLLASLVTGNTVKGQADTKYASARGGGVYADTVKVYASTVSGNAAVSPTKTTYGGGVYAKNVIGKYATISENSATSRAGVSAGTALTLTSSTISANVARDFTGGAHLVNGTANLYNSTIAFNSAGAPQAVGGITAGAVHSESSIIARNTAANAASDIAASADGNITGAHNLIMVSNVAVPQDTIRTDPQLGPLQDNGGLTWTHALRPSSPAVDGGANPLANEYDQRFDIRQIGTATDIGAFELDELFAGNFEDPN